MNRFSDQGHQAEGEFHPVDERFSRRSFLKAGIAAGAGLAALGLAVDRSFNEHLVRDVGGFNLACLSTTAALWC